MSQDFLDQMTDAIRTRVPIVVVPTSDPVHTADKLQKLPARIQRVNEDRAAQGRPLIPAPNLVEWSAARMFTYPTSLSRFFTQKGMQTAIPSESFARVAAGFPDPEKQEEVPTPVLQNTMFVMFNSSEILVKEDPRVLSALMHCRRTFSEGCHNVVVLLVQTAESVPGCIMDISYVIEDPLPTKKEIPQIVERVVESLSHDPIFPVPGDADLTEIYTAVRGMTAFRADQNLYMSGTVNGIDVEKLRRAQITTLNSTPGLKVMKPTVGFEDVGGLANAMDYLDGLLPQSEGVLVFMDEADKQFRGSNTDSSGVSSSQAQMMLSHLEDTKVQGITLLGHPGTGKTLLASAAGKRHDILTVAFTLEGAKGMYVGQSGKKTSQALGVLEAMYGTGLVPAVWIITCNDIDALTPEMQRRFGTTFFCDLPTKEERDSIWKIYLAREDRLGEERPKDDNWTGAEIAKCVTIAKIRQCSLIEAARFLVPSYKSTQATIEARRYAAADKYLSASYPGEYHLPQSPQVEVVTQPSTPSQRFV